MLLSYYDTYWNDNFVSASFDQPVSVSSTPNHSVESPGTISDNELLSAISRSSPYTYLDIIYNNLDCFHLSLINNGINNHMNFGYIPIHNLFNDANGATAQTLFISL